MGLFSRNSDRKKAYSVIAASGMQQNTGLAFIMQMSQKGAACIEDFKKKFPEAGQTYQALYDQIGKKGTYKLVSEMVSNPLTVISLPKPYDPVDGAEQMIVKKTGRSLSSLKAEEGGRFFMHTYEYAPQRKDIEYKVCVIYYFEP